MATTTPNFGWSVPTSTDYVKDGAAAIETLGDAIDASLVDLKGGTTGQVLSKNTNADMDFTWVTQDDANAIQNTIVDAKGDLITATAADTPARLAVGTNGQVLTADSTAATGLKWASPGGAPAGSLIFHAANTAPTGYLKANGAAISRTTYADLFSAIGTTFGTGDGSTTFNVPDLRGYFPRGWADNGSIDSGRSFGTSQTATSVLQSSNTSVHNIPSDVQNNDGNAGSFSTNYSGANSGTTATRYYVRPYNVALLACIKF